MVTLAEVPAVEVVALRAVTPEAVVVPDLLEVVAKAAAVSSS